MEMQTRNMVCAVVLRTLPRKVTHYVVTMFSSLLVHRATGIVSTAHLVDLEPKALMER